LHHNIYIYLWCWRFSDDDGESRRRKDKSFFFSRFLSNWVQFFLFIKAPHIHLNKLFFFTLSLASLALHKWADSFILLCLCLLHSTLHIWGRERQLTKIISVRLYVIVWHIVCSVAWIYCRLSFFLPHSKIQNKKKSRNFLIHSVDCCVCITIVKWKEREKKWKHNSISSWTEL
jgi:hypothetical protein